MRPTTVDNVLWLEFQDVRDPRGRLTAVEGEVHTPFPIARVFYVYDVPPGIERGGHAHRHTDHIAIPVHGSFRIQASDRHDHRNFLLDDPRRGLYLPRMIWTRLYDFNPHAVCLFLASAPYDASASVRSWSKYLAALHDETSTDA